MSDANDRNLDAELANDAGRRGRLYEAACFPQARKDRFWAELSGRLDGDRGAPPAATPLVLTRPPAFLRAAAAALVLAGGIAAGVWTASLWKRRPAASRPEQAPAGRSTASAPRVAPQDPELDPVYPFGRGESAPDRRFAPDGPVQAVDLVDYAWPSLTRPDNQRRY